MSDDGSFELPSRRYGRYRVRTRLGSGGMAEIFLADVVDDNGENQTVALKLMKPEASTDAFAAEADLMGLLQHPNLVERYEVGEAFGRPYIAMEYLLSGDLDNLTAAVAERGEPFPLGVAVTVGVEVLKALAHFHQLKTLSGRALLMVHGDVTPSNILFSAQGGVKLGDFGVARSRIAPLGTSQEMRAVGKLHYLAPELVRGETPTFAADLFSLGIVLYQLATGQHPFHNGDGTQEEVMTAQRQARFKPPPTLHRMLAGILQRALAPDPKARFRSAGEFAGALTQHMLEGDLLVGPARMAAWLADVLGVLT